ncbi:MAG: DUF983 domain-containing protein [Actinomycetota bacterium]
MRGDFGAAQGPPGVEVSAPVALWRGLTRRCPACGQGKLFRNWFKLANRCPRCGLILEREEGAFLGSLAINYGVTGVTTITFVIVMLVRQLPDPSVFTITAGAIALTLVVPLFFYPFAKTLWAAMDLLMHRKRAARR